MIQPIKKSGTYQKPRSKTVKKRKKTTTESKPTDKRLPPKKNPNGKKPFKRVHAQKYGTSNLEKRFAQNFLDKLNIKYVYQFEAKSIKRFFDFYIPDANILIEVDGDFYHSYGLVYEQMNPMQKKNRRVDEQKNRWAAINGIKLIRIWEHDINEHPEMVLEWMRYEFGVGKEAEKRKLAKKSRHNPLKTEDLEKNADENKDSGDKHGEQEL